MPKVTYREPVRTFHIDINGHVNNAVYVQWLEVGRTLLLEAAELPVEVMRERGYLPILVETRIQYRKPLSFPDTARIEVWVDELTHVSAWMAFRIHSEATGALAATARQRGVFVDAATNRPHRLPEDDRRRFEAVLDTGPDDGAS
jgi:acyl-CoA thioester hydrolase